MNITRRKKTDERKVLVSMIMDDTVCARIAPQWKSPMFQSEWSNIVGELCADYFKKFEKAPKEDIAPIFEKWSEDKDKDTVAIVERFLSTLSDEYEQTAGQKNSKYLIHRASTYFARVKAEKLIKRISIDLEEGQVEQAVTRIKEFRELDLNHEKASESYNDPKEIDEAFDAKKEPLLKLPGDLGIFFGNTLQRGAFIILQGPEKIGKTTWLTYLAHQCVRQRLRVAFFSCGDEDKAEINRRLATLISKHPLYPGEVVVPRAIKRVGKEIKMRIRRRTFNAGLSPKKANECIEKFRQTELRSSRIFFRLMTYGGGTLSIPMLEGVIKNWEQDEWLPDVIVLDYMDILMESGHAKNDRRDRINQTWLEFRSLLARYNILGISATQTNRASSGASYITREHTSEDKRKMAHPTGVIGLVQTDPEKARGIVKLNWVVGRGFNYAPHRQCICAGSMAIGNPAIRSLF